MIQKVILSKDQQETVSEEQYFSALLWEILWFQKVL